MEDVQQELFGNYPKKSSTPTQRGKEIIASKPSYDSWLMHY